MMVRTDENMIEKEIAHEVRRKFRRFVCDDLVWMNLFAFAANCRALTS